jgi:hypothetical protein
MRIIHGNYRPSPRRATAPQKYALFIFECWKATGLLGIGGQRASDVIGGFERSGLSVFASGATRTARS